METLPSLSGHAFGFEPIISASVFDICLNSIIACLSRWLIWTWIGAVCHVLSYGDSSLDLYCWSIRWWLPTTASHNWWTSSMSVMDASCLPSGHVVVPAAASTVTCVYTESKTYDRVDKMTSTSQCLTDALLNDAVCCVSTTRVACCTWPAPGGSTASIYGGTLNRVDCWVNVTEMWLTKP